MFKSYSQLHVRSYLIRYCLVILVAQPLLVPSQFRAFAQDSERNDSVPQLFGALSRSLQQGPSVLSQEQLATLMNDAARATGSTEALGQLAINPRLTLGVEVSAGYKPSGWLVMPKMQLGMEERSPSIGAKVETTGVFQNLGSFQIKFNPDDEKPSLTATFSTGGIVHERVNYQRRVSLEFKFKNRYDYLTALGLDSRNVPGARTTLWAMDQVLKSPSWNQPIQGAGPNSERVTVMQAVTDELRQILPPMFEASNKFESVTVGVGNSLTFDRELLEAYMIKSSGSLNLSYMDMERVTPEQRSGQTVKFSQTSIGVGLGAKWDRHPNFVVAPRGEGDVGAVFTYSNDPEKKLDRVDPARVEFANMLRDGRFAEAASVAMKKMVPILRADDIQDVIGKIRSWLGSENPNGVKIGIDDGMLRKALNAGTVEDEARMLDDLSQKLSIASPTEQQNILASFTKDVKTRFKGTKHLRTVENLAVVSLKSIVNRAEAYSSKWDQLPSDLRAPGNMTRIIGYVIDSANNDILIVGSVDPDSPSIELDDLIVGLRSVWREGNTPLVSLDPNPEDFTGPQNVRIQGIPTDSKFARTMLDADYIMKKIMGGVEVVSSPGYINYKEILARDRVVSVTRNRFWLYPVQPQGGDIQVSSDGNSALFMSGVQVLSEEMLQTCEGIVGTGHTMGAAEEAAISFTHHYNEIERQVTVYKKLQALFDIALLARVWRTMKISSTLVDRFVSLPYSRVDIPNSYEGITVKVYRTGDQEYRISGGVEVKIGAGPRKWLVLDDPEINALRKRSSARSASGNVAVSYSDLSLHIPEPDNSRRDTTSLRLTTVVSRLNSGDATGALDEVTKMVRADPYDPEAVALRALINFYRNDLEAAKRDAQFAREIDSNDPMVVDLSSSVLFQCYLLEGKTDAALHEIDFALTQDPNSVRSRILRAEALVQLARPNEAREELHKAIQMDPTSALALAKLGMLETSEGYVTTGRKQINKAAAMAKALNQESLEIKVAQALAEMSAAVYGNVSTQMTLAQKLAEEALASPACDRSSALGALMALTGSAMFNQKYDKADEYVKRARRLVPFSTQPLIFAAELAFEGKREDIARKYLAEAERLAPNNPAVQSLRQKIGR